jgi:hypothetical protein
MLFTRKEKNDFGDFQQFVSQSLWIEHLSDFQELNSTPPVRGRCHGNHQPHFMEVSLRIYVSFGQQPLSASAPPRSLVGRNQVAADWLDPVRRSRK